MSVEQEVGGSGPPNCTNKNSHLDEIASQRNDRWEALGKPGLWLLLRQAIAQPFYTVGLLLFVVLTIAVIAIWSASSRLLRVPPVS
jgi:hypothetical protein